MRPHVVTKVLLSLGCINYPRTPAHCRTEDSQAIITESPAPSHTLQCLRKREQHQTHPSRAPVGLEALAHSQAELIPWQAAVAVQDDLSQWSCSTGITQGGKLGPASCSEETALKQGQISHVCKQVLTNRLTWYHSISSLMMGFTARLGGLGEERA